MTSPLRPDAPSLHDVAVVEWGRGVAAGYAGRMLADFGARVTRFTTDAGDPHRDGDPEVRAWLDAGKAHAGAPAPAPRAEHLRALLSTADILVTDYRGDGLAGQLGAASPLDVNPRLVTVCVTPFGLSGPYGSWRGGDLEVAFLSGLAYLTPRDIPRPEAGPLPPPLKMPSSLVSIYAGASAAAAALCGLVARGSDGPGAVVDVSMLESLIPTLRREIALAAIDGRVASRFMRVWRLAPYGVKRCRDGHVFLQVVEQYHWEGLVEMMGRPQWALDPRYLDAEYRFAHRADIEARLAPWLLEQHKADFAWEAQRRGVPFAAVNEPADVLRIPQLHHRRFFQASADSDGRPCVVPGTPYAFERREAPDAGQREWRTRDPQAGPLAGLRVIDFGHVWAGPYCAALLADMGAEVIKVESRHRVDIHRRQGPYARGSAGVNRSGVWNAQNRGKRSVALNLSTEQGRSLAQRLVACADVVIENFAPGVMKRLGLDYARLSAVKPDLVMASLSAFGQDGPQKTFVGYGPSLDAWASLDWLTAYPGGDPNALGGMFPDTGSAIHAAAAVLAALHRRDRTGEGRYIDVSELEVSALLAGDVLAGTLAGRRPHQLGNGDRYQFPHGCYACRGEDAWVALSVPDAGAWEGLCALLGRDDWRSDDSLASSAGRRSKGAEIDRAIAEWAAARDATGAMAQLQAANVPAGIAHTPASLLDDPHLRARGYFSTVEHPEAGQLPVYGPIWRFTGQPARRPQPAPLLGADSEHVLRNVLGVDATEYESLVAARVVY
jgi:crotonobetainyl-CoA:carnitine CoA-transferase CaiB-like acyl-CoA transferase